MMPVNFLFILVAASVVTTSKLNLPRVLLPLFKTSSTNFTLKVTDNGCYKWSLSRLDIIQIIPLNLDKELDCSSEIILSTITKEFAKNTVIVLVEEVATKEVLRCDVIVDVISSLSIVTKTRQLFVEESPEIFEVRAYDEQGNEFSTLEGIEFSWTVSSGKSSQFVKNDVIRLINFKDSPYEIPKTIRNLDVKSLTGHVVLLEGIKTGTANITADLSQAEYKQVPSATVQLDVIANLIIEPADTYIMRGDVIHYKLLQVKNGRFIEVPLPSAQYSLNIEDKAVARQFRPWVVETLSLGQTKLVLSDINSKMSNVDDSTYLPSVTLNVVSPTYMNLILLPHRNWITTLHQPNAIVAELHDKFKHKIHIGPHAVVKIKVDEKFHILESTRNGSHVNGFAREAGFIHVVAEFHSVRTNDNIVIPFDRITAEADISVFPELLISPSEIVIPWDLVESPKLDYQLNITGGDGSYQWAIAHNHVAVVTQSGSVKPRSIGRTEVTSAMQKNPAIQTSAKIVVLPPAQLTIVHNTVEAKVGSPIFLAVALYYSKAGNPAKPSLFTDCTGFPFQISISNLEFVYKSSSRMETLSDACTTLSIVGRQAGNALVTVSYVSEGKLLKDVTRISAYQPLELVSPKSGKTVLSVGAQRFVVFTGGPNSDTNEDENVIVEFKEALVSAERIYGSNANKERIYLVTCHDVGDCYLTLKVLNKYVFQGVDSGHIAHRIEVVCAHPKIVHLSIDLENSELLSCPPSFRAKNMVLNDKPILLNVTVIDERGNVFDNATSLGVKWALSNAGFGEIRYPGIIKLEEENHVNYRLPVRHYQEVLPSSKAGFVEVTARILNYRKTWLKRLGIDLESIQSKVFKTASEETISLTLIHNLHLSSEFISIFNHPMNVAKLYVTFGSGIYKITSSAEKAAKINYLDASKSIDIVPLLPGSFVLTVRDECLPSEPIAVKVHILTISEIHVEVVNKIEKGKVVKAYLKLFDSEGNVVTKQELVNLKTELDSNVIRADCENNGRNDLRIVCRISGVEIGYANLIFKAGMENTVVRSTPVRIQVYPPLQIFPRNITLIPGAVIQLQVKGGPQPDCNIEYSVDNDVVRVDNSGNLIGDELGDSFVSVKATGAKTDGEKIVYSIDTVHVHVVYLKGIRLKCPLNEIKTGAMVPIWVEGIPEQINPLILTSVMPPLVFKWDVSPANLARISNVFEDAGVKVPDEDKMSMRIHTLKSGPIVVSVKVMVPRSIVPVEHKGRFIDSISVNIMNVYQITDYEYSPMLLAPAITYQLKSNKDKTAQVTYKMLKAESDKQNVVEVDKKGLVTTRDRYGFSDIQVDLVEDNEFVTTTRFLVKVSRVRYMMLNIAPALQIDPVSSAFGMPKGMKLQFVVSYHDNEGNQFMSTNFDTKLQMNKIEKIRASQNENKLVLDLLDSGVTAMKVFDDDLAIAPDYVKISTVPYIHPDKMKFTVGDFMCFQAVAAVPKGGHSCSWNSSNEPALSVNHNTGFAMAKSKQSNILVSFQCSNGLQMVTTADVYALQKVEILTSTLSIVSNNGKRVFIGLALLNEVDDGDIRKRQNEVAEKCGSQTIAQFYPYECDVAFSKHVGVESDAVFISYPSYDIEYGHVCVIESKEVNDPALSQVEIEIILKVTWNRYQHSKVTLPFKPAISVHKKKLLITDHETSDTLRVSGIPSVMSHLEVIPSNDAYVAVVEESSDTNNIRKYSVYLKSEYMKRSCNANQQLSVFILNKDTNQNITVPLLVDVNADQYSSPSYFTEQIAYYTNEYFLKVAITLLGALAFFTMGSKIYNLFFGKRMDDQSFFDLSHSKSHLSDRSMSPHYSYKKPSYNEIQMIYGRNLEDSARRRRN